MFNNLPLAVLSALGAHLAGVAAAPLPAFTGTQYQLSPRLLGFDYGPSTVDSSHHTGRFFQVEDASSACDAWTQKAHSKFDQAKSGCSVVNSRLNIISGAVFQTNDDGRTYDQTGVLASELNFQSVIAYDGSCKQTSTGSGYCKDHSGNSGSVYIGKNVDVHIEGGSGPTGGKRDNVASNAHIKRDDRPGFGTNPPGKNPLPHNKGTGEGGPPGESGHHRRGGGDVQPQRGPEPKHNPEHNPGEGGGPGRRQHDRRDGGSSNPRTGPGDNPGHDPSKGKHSGHHRRAQGQDSMGDAEFRRESDPGGDPGENPGNHDPSKGKHSGHHRRAQGQDSMDDAELRRDGDPGPGPGDPKHDPSKGGGPGNGKHAGHHRRAQGPDSMGNTELRRAYGPGYDPGKDPGNHDPGKGGGVGGGKHSGHHRRAQGQVLHAEREAGAGDGGPDPYPPHNHHGRRGKREEPSVHNAKPGSVVGSWPPGSWNPHTPGHHGRRDEVPDSNLNVKRIGAVGSKPPEVHLPWKPGHHGRRDEVSVPNVKRMEVDPSMPVGVGEPYKHHEVPDSNVHVKRIQSVGFKTVKKPGPDPGEHGKRDEMQSSNVKRIGVVGSWSPGAGAPRPKNPGHHGKRDEESAVNVKRIESVGSPGHPDPDNDPWHPHEVSPPIGKRIESSGHGFTPDPVPHEHGRRAAASASASEESSAKRGSISGSVHHEDPGVEHPGYHHRDEGSTSDAE